MKLFFFLAMSLVDLVLTWWLLEWSGRVVQEANPVADWWLARYGWPGLAAYKACLVFGTAALVRTIARHSTCAAERLLTLACAAVAVVVAHGIVLSRTAPTPLEFIAQQNRKLADSNAEAQQREQTVLAYAQLLESLCEDLLAERSTLAEVVDRLMQVEMNRDPSHQRVLFLAYRARCVQECLARQVLEALNDSAATPSDRDRVARQFGEMFEGRSPAQHDAYLQ